MNYDVHFCENKNSQILILENVFRNAHELHEK